MARHDARPDEVHPTMKASGVLLISLTCVFWVRVRRTAHAERFPVAVHVRVPIPEPEPSSAITWQGSIAGVMALSQSRDRRWLSCAAVLHVSHGVACEGIFGPPICVLLKETGGGLAAKSGPVKQRSVKHEAGHQTLAIVFTGLPFVDDKPYAG
ncbi:hypothetical protein S7711_10458 [Stachybotrys chartarum IBT 7711]|uniref:Uncharacterized protein n=1 Tax=Stachybotrys chartarum (strain CBS 109288 / IBT 7711) TaxID=1280523 RepID=A0A084BBV6_STACB|nr:hypothetical protein S7711_10458 [Stachybotrys chartarum IBT 7711]